MNDTPTPPPRGYVRGIDPLVEYKHGVSGNAIAVERAKFSHGVPSGIPRGLLWELVEKTGSGLEVIGDWLAWVEPDCGRCAPPYGCPPGSHAEPIRDLSISVRVPHEHRPGYECPRCGHLALRQSWVDSRNPWPARDAAHRALSQRAS